MASKTAEAPSGNMLLDVDAAAALLGLSTSALNKWRVSGSGPAFLRLGRAVRYAREDLDAWLRVNRRSSTSEAPSAA